MTRTKPFPDPRPRRRPLPQGMSFVYPTTGVLSLERGESLVLPTLDATLDARHSERLLDTPSISDLGRLLWFGGRTRQWRDAWPGPIQSRPAPAAGGLHALDLLVSRLPEAPGLSLYDPFAHALRPLSPFPEDVLEAHHHQMDVLFPENRGCVLTLLADKEKLNAKYIHWETLALRDAGALLATLGICAAALGLGFCFGGVQGRTLVQANPLGDHRIPVGTAILGRADSTDYK